MIFSRRRGNAGRPDNSGRHSADGTGTKKTRRGAGVETTTEDVGTEVETTAAFGPYDIAVAPDDGRERLDLGALRIPAISGVEIHLQTGPQGQIQQVQLAHEGSRLQLAAFAAPRTEDIWDDVRETLRSSLAASGSQPIDAVGEYGPELKAKVRDPAGTIDVRHVGIDGPRWFVHGVFLGPAAVDPDLAGPLLDVLKGLVVDRGTEARPVSEALPLRLPADAAAQLAEQQERHAEQQDSQAT